MIELKNVTTAVNSGGKRLEDYSRQIRNGDFVKLPADEGNLLINALLGFLPVESGYITFDGMPLSAASVSFFRKMMAYIPSPLDFPTATDLRSLQRKMIDEALASSADIILAVSPLSHQDDLEREPIITALRYKAQQGKLVIVTE